MDVNEVPLSTADGLVCQTCGGAIVPMRTSTTGYRHAPGLPECTEKPPLPAFTIDELIKEWVGHPAALQIIHGEVARLRAEVRVLRTERDAALNLLEGYAPELTRRLRDQMAFERAHATEGEP